MPECSHRLLLRATVSVGRVQQARQRVQRGGAWNNNGRNLRSAYRNHSSPGYRFVGTGLRLAGGC